MIEIFLAIYLSLVFVFGLVSLIVMNDKLKQMGNTKIILFLFLQPLLIIRDVLEK